MNPYYKSLDNYFATYYLNSLMLSYPAVSFDYVANNVCSTAMFVEVDIEKMLNVMQEMMERRRKIEELKLLIVLHKLLGRKRMFENLTRDILRPIPFASFAPGIFGFPPPIFSLTGI